MTIALAALVTMIALIFITKVPVAIAMKRSSSQGYDNRTPRQQQAMLTGWGARALAAHQNTFEALAIFTAALVASQLGSTPPSTTMLTTLATVHTVARILYPIFYIADFHVLRSLIWGTSFVCAIWIALLPVLG